MTVDDLVMMIGRAAINLEELRREVERLTAERDELLKKLKPEG